MLDGPGVGGGHGDGGLDGCPFLFLLLMLLIWLDRGRSWLGGADAPPPVAVLDGDDEADGASLLSFSAFSKFFLLLFFLLLLLPFFFSLFFLPSSFLFLFFFSKLVLGDV